QHVPRPAPSSTRLPSTTLFRSLDARHPVHVTVRLAEGLPSLRGKGTFAVVRECLRRAKERLGARVVHFAVLGNHVHLIVEAEGKGALARAMQGLKIREIGRASCRERGWMWGVDG